MPLTEEEKKAISQSLGHENVATTFGSYGYGMIDENKQVEIIRNIDFEGKRTGAKYILDKKDLEHFAEYITNKQKDTNSTNLEKDIWGI